MIGPERLQKIISAHGAASRRESEKLILGGRVTVNGVPAKLGDSALDGRDVIEIDGKALIPRGEMVYIMLNKPRGYVTTMKDERGRKTAVQLLTGVDSRVYPVGRLDMETEGLLLLTNDGRFANEIMHPSYSMEKTYEARVAGDLDAAVELLRRPMEIDSFTVQAVSVKLKERKADGGVLLITIREGRNRQIRKMCALCGLTIKALKRVSVGSLRLDSLKPGKWRYLTEEEVVRLREK